MYDILKSYESIWKDFVVLNILVDFLGNFRDVGLEFERKLN